MTEDAWRSALWGGWRLWLVLGVVTPLGGIWNTIENPERLAPGFGIAIAVGTWVLVAMTTLRGKTATPGIALGLGLGAISTAFMLVGDPGSWGWIVPLPTGPLGGLELGLAIRAKREPA